MKINVLHRNTRGVFEMDSLRDFRTGETYDDYLNGDVIPLSAGQFSFYLENPGAGVRDLIEMQLTPPPPEQSLDEMKESAIVEVLRDAERRLNELYPKDEVDENIIRALARQDDYFDGYLRAKSGIESETEPVISEIREAETITCLERAVERIREIFVNAEMTGGDMVDGKTRG